MNADYPEARNTREVKDRDTEIVGRVSAYSDENTSCAPNPTIPIIRKDAINPIILTSEFY